MGLFGVSAFELVGLRKAAVGGSLGRSAALFGSAFAALLVSAALMLSNMAEMMGLPVRALDGPTIKLLATETTIGFSALLRIVLLALAIGALAILRGRKGGLRLAAAFYALALVTLPWSGHAAVTEGLPGVAHRVVDALHLLATSLWMGAIGTFLYLTIHAHRNRESRDPASLIAAMRAFAPLGLALVTTATLTGLVNVEMIFELRNASQVIEGSYGQLLVVKIGLVFGMAAFGAFNAWSSRQADLAGVGIQSRFTQLKALRSSLAFELGLGLAAVGLVAVLGRMMPVA